MKKYHVFIHPFSIIGAAVVMVAFVCLTFSPSYSQSPNQFPMGSPSVAAGLPQAVSGTVTTNQGAAAAVASAWPVAPQPYPNGSTPVQSSSGVVANSVSTATLPAAVGKTTYLAGLSVTAAGATAAGCTALAVTGTFANHAHVFCVPVGAGTVQAGPLTISFSPPIPSSAVNTAIVLSMPGVGAGSTGQVVNAWGFQQ